MIKKTLVDDNDIYARIKESGLRTEVYYGRKLCDNDLRGHFAVEDGQVVCDRSTQALSVVNLSGSFCLQASGSIVCSIQNS